MNFKKYVELEECIEDRLRTFSLRINENNLNVEMQYINRLNNLKRAYPEETKHHLSKLMFNAYDGTIKYYEARK